MFSEINNKFHSIGSMLGNSAVNLGAQLEIYYRRYTIGAEKVYLRYLADGVIASGVLALGASSLGYKNSLVISTMKVAFSIIPAAITTVAVAGIDHLASRALLWIESKKQGQDFPAVGAKGKVTYPNIFFTESGKTELNTHSKIIYDKFNHYFPHIALLFAGATLWIANDLHKTAIIQNFVPNITGIFKYSFQK